MSFSGHVSALTCPVLFQRNDTKDGNFNELRAAVTEHCQGECATGNKGIIPYQFTHARVSGEGTH